MTAATSRLALLASSLVLGASVSPTANAEFKLELLHAADQEAGATAVQDAPRFSAVLNALRTEDLGNDGVADNTITLSSGDAFIPGLFFDASAGAFGSAGIADIQIQNELGFQAIAFGNHEFDFGTETLAELIDGSAPGAILGADFTGAAFPYLSTNLDYSTDPNMAPLEVLGEQAHRLASSLHR
jgi:2',3'-cyclic-nucleotide 2'-phosphodiesterase (5'-nucleotidase family)